MSDRERARSNNSRPRPSQGQLPSHSIPSGYSSPRILYVPPPVLREPIRVSTQPTYILMTMYPHIGQYTTVAVYGTKPHLHLQFEVRPSPHISISIFLYLFVLCPASVFSALPHKWTSSPSEFHRWQHKGPQRATQASGLAVVAVVQKPIYFSL